jgi:hypothetical protein
MNLDLLKALSLHLKTELFMHITLKAQEEGMPQTLFAFVERRM